MLPCAHVHYSLLAIDTGTAEQVVGAVLPDAAVTKAFSWTDFHDPARVREFERSGVEGMDDLLMGVRHHIALDQRSHDSWDESDQGYAYAMQSPELVGRVEQACGAEGEDASLLAHSFIETAIELHVLRVAPHAVDRLRRGIAEFESRPFSMAAADWLGSGFHEMEWRIADYLDIWQRHELRSVEGMVRLWHELLEHMGETVLAAPPSSLDERAARKAIELAVDLTLPTFGPVVTP